MGIMTLVIARDFRQYEAFIYDVVEEGMDRKDFIFISHVEMLRNHFGAYRVVKLQECYDNKVATVIDLYEDHFFHAGVEVYTKPRFILEQRVKRALKNNS